jgi:alkaline phosphatase
MEVDYPIRQALPNRKEESSASLKRRTALKIKKIICSCLFAASLNGCDYAQESRPSSLTATDAVATSSDSKTVAPADDEERNAIAADDFIALMQHDAIKANRADWGHWGIDPQTYSGWTGHSNRMIPVYLFNCSLADYTGANSPYRNSRRLASIYHRVPTGTVDPEAICADQTDVFRLQQDLVHEGYNRIILIVFDGMDWQTTWIAATYAANKAMYREGRGTGLTLQDYAGTSTEFAYYVTSPYDTGGTVDVNAQIRTNDSGLDLGGYAGNLGGRTPWDDPVDRSYLIDRSRAALHAVTDSSSSATSLMAGIKTFNGAICVDEVCRPVETIAHQVQRDYGWSVGTITSVPISHATPAAAYAHNVSRDDYQDLSRDMLGIASISDRMSLKYPGLDVIIGCGWGVDKLVDDELLQGSNFIPGNQYLTEQDLELATTRAEGAYIAAQRTAGRKGVDVLTEAAQQAIASKKRLLGFFGTQHGHLPYRTANGDYKPVKDAKTTEQYSAADIDENPQLADMARVGLDVLGSNPTGFWAMIEAGDVDWANHANNVDSSIGAVHSGDKMVKTVFEWIEAHGGWNKTAVIVTADHGHYLNIKNIEAFTRPIQE